MATEAQSRLSEASADLDEFNTLDQAVADNDYSSLQQCASDELPHELTVQLAFRSRAQDRYDRALVLRDRCNKELAAAEAKLPEHNLRAQHAINAIAIYESRRLVTELDAAEQVVEDLRTRIVSLQLQGASTPADIVNRAFAALQPPKPSDNAKATWKSFLKALRDDPDAQLEP